MCESPIAASVVLSYSEGIIDWFLPTRDELNALVYNLGFYPSGNIDGLDDDAYWTSSETYFGVHLFVVV